VITLLGPQLRVRTPTGLTTYPDITVICGPREIDDIDPLAITTPALIVETFSSLRASAPWRSGHVERMGGGR